MPGAVSAADEFLAFPGAFLGVAAPGEQLEFPVLPGDLEDAARSIRAALAAPRGRAMVQVPVTLERTIRATTITRATDDCPANKAPAIGHSLLPRIDAFVRLRVLVIGEATPDSYLDGHTGRPGRKAPVPVVGGAAGRDAPDSHAHAAIHAAALDARVTFLSAVGDDEDTTRLGTALEALEVPSDGLLRPRGRRTLLKQRVLAGGQLAHDLSPDQCAYLRAHLRAGGYGAATMTLGHGGATTCTAAAQRLHIGSQHELLRPGQLGALADDLRRAGKRIVFTSGCFDILHRGHISYLGNARALGDVLIVGLHTDASVRRLRGASRPINRAGDRAQMLAALSCVDHIVELPEDTPMALLERLRPDIYVRGGDHTRATLPEAPLVERLGGQVRLLPDLAQLSTTDILVRIGERRPPRRAR